MLAMTVIIGKPVIATAIALIGCLIWTIIKRKKVAPIAIIALWLIVPTVTCILAYSAETVIKENKKSAAIKAKYEKQRAETLSIARREKREQRRDRNRATRLAQQAEWQDKQIALKQMWADIPEWDGIRRVLSSSMTIDAKVTYIANTLQSPDPKICPLPKISLNQQQNIIELLECHKRRQDCYELTKTLSVAFVPCLDPLKIDALEKFAQQKNADKYDPKNYLQDDTE